MTIDKVWVLAEAGETAAPVTLELLTEARQIASTVEAVSWGSGAAAQAPTLGEHGATKVYDVGDLDDSPGVGPHVPRLEVEGHPQILPDHHPRGHHRHPPTAVGEQLGDRGRLVEPEIVDDHDPSGG